MIFGRRKRNVVDETESDVDTPQSDVDPADAEQADEGIDQSVPGDQEETAERDADAAQDPDDGDAAESDESELDETEAEEPEDEPDQWEELDASRDWRVDGPFDISEVDLDADEIQRLDFGTLVLTPFDGMNMQLQVNKESQNVQALLITHAKSVLELSLFAAPADRSTVAQVRTNMIDNVESAGGSVTLAEGPFGTEIRRVVPITTDNGQHGYHVSRTWFAQGPRWLLRGVLMGEAGMSEGHEGPAEMLYEFFANTVVRRGNKPMVPGDVIPMVLPEAMHAQLESQVGTAQEKA